MGNALVRKPPECNAESRAIHHWSDVSVSRFLSCFFGLSTIAAILGGCQGARQDAPRYGAAAASLKRVTLTLNWIPYGEHAPFYYGLEKGYFRAAGIDLTIQPGNGSGKTVQAVGGGQSTFGWADTPSLIKAIASGVPVRSVGVFVQTTPSAVEFFSAKEIHKPSDLKGKSIAVTPGDAVFQTFPALLAANNVAPDEVNMVNVDPSGKLSVLMAGKVDAITGFFNDQAPTIERRSGKKVSVLKYAENGVPFLGDGLLASNDTITSDPALVRAFVQAAIKSWEAAKNDPAGAIQAMLKAAEKTPPADVLSRQLKLTLQLMNTPATAGGRPGVDSESDWKQTIQILARYAGLKRAGPPADYWNGSFAAA